MKQLAFLLLILLTGTGLLAQPGIDHTATTFPTDDGHDMAIDYYLSGDSSAKPTILIQTPYNRKLYRFGFLPVFGQDFVNSNYHVVIADWRGFYENNSVPMPQGFDRGLDGVDCIEWIRQQPWSNGQVVTYGGSALGKIQYQTARYQPEGLVAICPSVAYPGTLYEGYFDGGVMMKEYLNTLDALGYGLGTIVSNNYVYNNLWSVVEAEAWYMDEIDVPVFSFAGWYDHNMEGQLLYFDTLLVAGDPSVTDEHKLLIGPWTHGGVEATGPGTIEQGELEHPNAASKNVEMALQFFDYYARNQQNGWDTVSTYTYYTLGSETWQYADTWPQNVTDKLLYLHPDDLTIDDQLPTTSESLSFQVDPTAPTLTIGGQTLSEELLQGPYDQSVVVESRADVAVLTTTPFTDTLKIRGHIRLQLYVSVDRPDADVSVRLTDVYPDGRSILLEHDMQRLRFLEGNRPSDTVLVTPGETVLVELTLPPLALDLAPDHRLRLILAGNNAPHYDVNLQNGGELYTVGDSLVASHTYFSSPLEASLLRVPVLNPEVTSSRDQVLSSAEAVRIWPNPASDLLRVQLPTAWQSAQLEVFNTAGQRMQSSRLQQSVTRVGLDLPAGLYLVRVSNSGQQHTQRLLIRD